MLLLVGGLCIWIFSSYAKKLLLHQGPEEDKPAVCLNNRTIYYDTSGLYTDNGQENGNYYFIRGHITTSRHDLGIVLKFVICLNTLRQAALPLCLLWDPRNCNLKLAKPVRRMHPCFQAPLSLWSDPQAPKALKSEDLKAPRM